MDGVGVEDKEVTEHEITPEPLKSNVSAESDQSSIIKENNNIVVEIVSSTPIHKANGTALSNHR